MRYSESFIYTLKEEQKEAGIVSHDLLLRGGFISKLASGIYNYLPLGVRVIKKVSDIVREEMNRAGAQEILMANIQPAELWAESKRWNDYGKELLRIKDRAGRDFVFGPTHEEVVTDIVRHFVKSYRDLPINLYQIQTKFRDEIRPRFGLMRAREFIMKDAYSFDADQSGLDISYDKMREAYYNIFLRCGLKARSVQADSGSIGGRASEEFMILSSTGEDEIVTCDNCRYSANMEKAESITQDDSDNEMDLKKVATPGKQTIKDVCEYLNSDDKFSAKALLYKNEEGLFFCFLVEGDDELNETKAARATDSVELLKLNDNEIKASGLYKGYIGPVHFPNKNIKIICDERLKNRNHLIVGANEEGYHYMGAKLHRDFEPDLIADIRSVKENEICPECKKGILKKTRGIEVGHIFKLGSKYSESMHAAFLNRDGKPKPFLMGCYGIGIGRTAQAAVEQNNDKNGIVWPISIAPFEVELISLDTRNEDIKKYCDNLYNVMLKRGMDVLYDDRSERVGVKLNDSDLIGIPIRIIVGKRNFMNHQVELSLRQSSSRQLVDKDSIIENVVKLVNELYLEINKGVKYDEIRENQK